MLSLNQLYGNSCNSFSWSAASTIKNIVLVEAIFVDCYQKFETRWRRAHILFIYDNI
jgi:hypothetical protein